MLFRSFVGFALVLVVFATLVSADPCPQVGLRSDAWVAAVVDKLWTIRYSDERLAYLSQQVHNDTRAFSGAQLASLMPPLVFAVEMVQAMNFTSRYVIGLNASEVVQVLDVLQYSNDKLTVLSALKDSLLNASDDNKMYIAKTAFKFSSDQDAALQILKNITARDCVFGTVDARSATFVIDVSGSMDTAFVLEGKRYSRLSYVKEHLSRVIGEQLRPYQQFNVILFADRTVRCFPTSVNAKAHNIKTALAFLARYGAGGGTNTYAGLSDAFSLSATTVAVYLLSDGLPNSGQAPQIISALPQWNARRPAEYQIKVFSTAFLLGQSSAAEKQQSAAFMQQVAAVTNGVYRHMDDQQ